MKEHANLDKIAVLTLTKVLCLDSNRIVTDIFAVLILSKVLCDNHLTCIVTLLIHQIN